jgi:hypothetical protein
MIPAEPEKGLNEEDIVPAGTESEDKFRLKTEIEVSFVVTSFALFIITSPKSNMIEPPTFARNEMDIFSMKEEAPIRISTKKASSTRACPMKTEGPTRQPFFKAAPIVANIMGPGISAADIPTVKPRIRALISSIITYSRDDRLHKRRKQSYKYF